MLLKNRIYKLWRTSIRFRCIMMAMMGLLFTVTFAPFAIWPLTLVIFPSIMLCILNAKNLKEVTLLGWLFGFTHYVSSLYWIANSLEFEADKFAWLAPFVVLGIPAFLAVLMSINFIITFLFKDKPAFALFIFSSIWCLTELVRGYILFFPWNFAAYILTGNNILLQMASVCGLTGCSFLVVFLSTSIIYLRSIKLAAAFAVICFLIVSFGFHRLQTTDIQFHEDVLLKLIQPNFERPHFGNTAVQQKHLRKLIELTVQPPQEGVTHIIWPEAAFPYLLRENDHNYKTLAALAPSNGSIIFGADRIEVNSLGVYKIFNSMHVLDTSGLKLAQYDKRFLVPFGEYVPFREHFSGIEKIAQGIGDFTSGHGERSINIPNLPKFLPSICYEIADPSLKYYIADQEWILNITTDIWFGDTIGPHQHFAIAKFRAAETGLPIIRASNTGISAVIDPLGLELDRIDYGIAGYIISRLPKAIR